MPTGRYGLRSEVIELVGATPRSRDDIVRDVSEGGHRIDRHELDRLLQDDTAFTDVELGVVHVPSLLEGTTWTVWVDADDALDGFVRMHPHLEAMGWWLIDGDVELVDDAGASLGEVWIDSMWLDGRDSDVVLGPAGWLADLAGTWASVRVSAGALCWTACAEAPHATDAQIAAIRAGFEAAARTDSAIALDDRPPPPGGRHAYGDKPVHEALVRDRDAFVKEPIPPLPDLYEAAGLEQRDSVIAERGFEWDAYRAWQDRNRFAVVHGLDDEQTDRLVFALGACSAVVAEGTDRLGETEDERQAAAIVLAGILEDGAVAEAFWDENEGRGRSPEEMGRFADELLARLESVQPVGLSWIRARGLDLGGDAVAAMTLLEQAVTPDSTHQPALIELAGFLADRGDALGASALLRRAGVTEPDDDDDTFTDLDDAERLLLEVSVFAHRPRPAAGRNDRCPCGSGRKYKVCHLGRERHPLEDRAGWLYEKARRFLRRRAPEAPADLAREVGETSGSRALSWDLHDSPWLADLALHEGGLFAEFVAQRDSLLPDDEAVLAAQWALVNRAVFEIEAVRRDRLELHDIGRGERITVVNTTANERARTGLVLVGRPLPVGDTYRAFSGFVEIPRSRVGDFLRAIDAEDPADLAALFGATLRPPQVQNTDGEDLVFHTLRWRCPDPERVDAALQQAGLRRDGEAEWSLVRDSANQPSTVIVSVRLAGDVLSADVNSDARATEIRALVASAVPDAELIEDDERSFDEVMADIDPSTVPNRPDLGDPALREALKEFIAEKERRWLDESIPALGGRTPREAALDPIGREELEHLLDSFPVPGPDDVAAMNPDRLRAALAL